METFATPVFGSTVARTVLSVGSAAIGSVNDSTIPGSVDGLSDIPDSPGTEDIASAGLSLAAAVPGRAVDACAIVCCSSFMRVGSNFRIHPSGKRGRDMHLLLSLE